MVEKSNLRCESDRAPHFPNAAFDIVALVASASGVDALTQVLSGLPANFPAPISIVQHLQRDHRSYMADILNRCTLLRV